MNKQRVAYLQRRHQAAAQARDQAEREALIAEIIAARRARQTPLVRRLKAQWRARYGC